MEGIEIPDLNTQVKPAKGAFPAATGTGAEKTKYQKKIESYDTFLALITKNPMSDAVIEEVKKRKIRVGDKWLIDFASCNYLGFDVDPEVMASVTDHIEELSTYPGQSRLLGSPYLYEKIEQEIIDLTGVESCIALPSITLTHIYSIPFLAAEGDIFLDKRAHKTMYDGCSRAREFGAVLKSFEHNDPDHLEEQLKQSTAKNKMICVDGVYSMHGYPADVPRILELARKYDAWLYIDDAHGFGVIGERGDDELCPFGKKGNGVIRYFNESYDKVIMIGSLSKAYSALLGFIACPKELTMKLKIAIESYLYSGPAPIPALSALLKSFEINRQRGDEIRAHLYKISKYLDESLAKLGYRNENHTGFPVYRVTIENADDIHAIGEYLYDNGIYVTLAPYPLVPKHEVGFRIQLTAANTQEEVEYLVEVLRQLGEKFAIQKEKSAVATTEAVLQSS